MFIWDDQLVFECAIWRLEVHAILYINSEFCGMASFVVPPWILCIRYPGLMGFAFRPGHTLWVVYIVLSVRDKGIIYLIYHNQIDLFE